VVTTRITATELARNLSDILNRVRYRDGEFVVERGGEVVAVLGPAPSAREQPAGIRLSELVARLGSLTTPGNGFADDLERIQANQPPAEPIEWPS
jgi:prevent-host-death family protein